MLSIWHFLSRGQDRRIKTQSDGVHIKWADTVCDKQQGGAGAITKQENESDAAHTCTQPEVILYLSGCGSVPTALFPQTG